MIISFSLNIFSEVAALFHIQRLTKGVNNLLDEMYKIQKVYKYETYEVYIYKEVKWFKNN